MNLSTPILFCTVSLIFLGCEDASPPVATGGDASLGGSTGGTATAGAPGEGGKPATSGRFELLFRDDFETFDASRWGIMTHSWASNLALFSTESVSVSDGFMSLRLLPAPDGTTDETGAEKTFLGAEVRSKASLSFGRVRARAKLARGSAVVSSLVTIYTPWPADNWNELDIECLGKDPTEVQSNVMVYTGPPVTPPVTTSVSPTEAPERKKLGFDASEDFHEYELEWTPAGATFSVDDTVIRTWNERTDLLTLPQNVLLTIWASSSAAWAGAVTADTSTAEVVYDWVELSSYVP